MFFNGGLFPPLAVAEGPYAGVVKLQTMRCLFEAYEHVLFLLENVFTPMFCHSDEVTKRESLPLSPPPPTGLCPTHWPAPLPLNREQPSQR